MSGATFVRFYPSDWRSGCIGLTCELEGFYWRVCAHYYETGVRLPLDDDEARARLCGMDRRAYRRLKNDLIEKGLMHEQHDGYSIPRCEEELRLALARTAAKGKQETPVDSPREDARKEPDYGRVADEPQRQVAAKSEQSRAEVEPKSAVIRPDFGEKTQQNQRPFIEPIANSHKEVPQTPKGASDDMPSNVKAVTDWKQAFADPMDHAGVVRTEAGGIQLVNGTRQAWLDRFDGDSKRLDLALIEISGLVNDGSRKPLKSDVERHLARMAGERHDRSENYAKAVARNQSKDASKAKSRGYLSRY